MNDDTILCPQSVVRNIEATKNYALVFRHAEKAVGGKIPFRANPDPNDPVEACRTLDVELTQDGVGDATCIGNTLKELSSTPSYVSEKCRTARTAAYVLPGSNPIASSEINPEGDLTSFLRNLDGNQAIIFTHEDPIEKLITGKVGEILVGDPQEAEAFVIDLSKVGTNDELPKESLVARIEHHEWEGCGDRREIVGLPGG